MPRPRARTLFELGGQWIAEEPGRPGLYRFWHDAGNGRTRRASLGTTDLEEAKSKLAEIVVRGAPATDRTPLTIVLERYFQERTDFLPSAKPARHAGRLFLECWGPVVRTHALDPRKLKEFVDWSVKHGHSMSYIARNFSVLAAALSNSSLQLDIPMKAGAILDKWPDLKDKPKRRLFEPTDGELARLLAQPMPESLRRWLLNSMATLARPTAVAQLTPGQRDRRTGLVSLNAEGRRQNKKFRPTVREPEVMTKWLNEWELGTNESRLDPNQPYCGYTNRSSIHSVLRRACAPEKADLPRMALYSIRHRGTTVLRAAKVPKEQIDYQLGHVQQGARTTQGYGQYEAVYLAEAAAALDAWVRRVLKLSRKQTAKARLAA
jgi:hypothetical protein